MFDFRQSACSSPRLPMLNIDRFWSIALEASSCTAPPESRKSKGKVTIPSRIKKQIELLRIRKYIDMAIPCSSRPSEPRLCRFPASKQKPSFWPDAARKCFFLMCFWSFSKDSEPSFPAPVAYLLLLPYFKILVATSDCPSSRISFIWISSLSTWASGCKSLSLTLAESSCCSPWYSFYPVKSLGSGMLDWSLDKSYDFIYWFWFDNRCW